MYHGEWGRCGVKDTIFRKKKDPVEPFRFTREVAEVFDDMARRSIPGYDLMQSLIAGAALRFYREGTGIYDLGCSTGNSITSILEEFGRRMPRITPRIHGIDSSPDMIEIARKRIRCEGVSVGVGDIAAFDAGSASVVLSAYTLQFVSPELRGPVIGRICRSLAAGGVFILAEKLRAGDPVLENFITGLYHDFKRKNGYSNLEIEQKDRALENVLIPFTLEEYRRLIDDAGFRSQEIIFRQYNFTCILAVK